MQNFRELTVWRKAHELTLEVYRVTAGFPKSEIYGLTSQLRRAASSVAANLAEGCGRNGDAEFARFCAIAIGSASELDYHILLAHDLHLIGPHEYTDLAGRVTEVKKMLSGLHTKLKS